jgi:hypothetical protein
VESPTRCPYDNEGRSASAVARTGPSVTAPRLKGSDRRGGRLAPAAAVWSMAPTLLLLCLQPARAWLTAIRCRIAVAKQHSSDAMRARLLAFRPPTTEHGDCCSARPIRQARGRRGRACRLPANLPATRSRRRSHEGDAPPGSRARLASKPDPDIIERQRAPPCTHRRPPHCRAASSYPGQPLKLGTSVRQRRSRPPTRCPTSGSVARSSGIARRSASTRGS